MSLVRWEDFQQLCEISDTLENPIFGRLWKSVKLHLRNEPKNSIGVMGPKKGKEKFTLWTIKYLDSGIGKQYWGSGTGGKWKFEEDRTHIVNFFRNLVVVLASAERHWRREKVNRHRTGALRRSKGAEVGEKGEEENEGFREEEEAGDNYYEPEEPGDNQLEVQGEYENKVSGKENQSGDNYQEPYRPRSQRTKTSSTQESLEISSAIAEGAGELVKREPSLPPDSFTLLSSIRRYALEGTPIPFSECLQQFESTPQDVGSLLTISNPTDAHEPNADRVFETRLGNDKTVAFLFAPQTINFQDFFSRFCGVWRRGIKDMDIRDVEVKICMAGVGEYWLSFGESRQRSWLHIMEVFGSRPDSNILVTMVFG